MFQGSRDVPPPSTTAVVLFWVLNVVVICGMVYVMIVR